MASVLRAPAYQLFMLALCVLALAIIVVQNLFAGDPEIEVLLQYADTAICIPFFIDFLLSLRRAPNRWRYFFTWGWLDLLSSIPTFDLARWGRLARIARIARVLRALRATTMLTRAVLRQRTQSTTLGAAIVAFLLIVGSSTAILQFEKSDSANIRTAEDAVWWAFTTVTTVGYGDKFPTSSEGRLIAVLLMTGGISLFGALTAALAAWFLAPEKREQDDELTALRQEVAALREAVERMAAKG